MLKVRRASIRLPPLLVLPIRVRIAFFGLAVVALTVAVFSLLLYALIAAGAPAEQDQQLRRRAEAAVAAIERTSRDDVQVGRAPISLEAGASFDVVVRVLSSDGTPISSLADLPDLNPIRPELLALATANGSALETVEAPDGESFRVYVLAWRRPDLGLNGHAVAAQSIQRIRSDLRGLRAFLWLSASITLLAVSAAMWAMAGRALKPLKEMAGAADEIGHARDLGRRLPPGHANDEVTRLTASFNSMLARIEDAYQQASDALESQKRFVSDASHELRTPLTSIRSNAGFLLGRPDARAEDVRAALEDIAQESDRMSRLIENLLTLAKADAGFHLDRTPVDLEVLVREVTRQASTLHPDRSFRLRVLPDQEQIGASVADLPAGSHSVTGDQDALKQLLWILVENGARHVHEGGTVWLTLSRRRAASETTATDEATVWLQVADDGVGIREADLERIFERFYRADSSRTGEGTGLGLAIARWIVTDHGGRLWARNNELGGATFSVELPRAEPRSEVAPPEPARAHQEPPQRSSTS
jgi:two-component system, OmpR family, sensor kinase